MRKSLTILLSIISFTLISRAQGVGYQGVATDAIGIELVNQSITLGAIYLVGPQMELYNGKKHIKHK